MARDFSNGTSNRPKKVNTRFISFYNSNDPEYGSCLSISAWGTFICFGIAPIIPEDDRKGANTYDYNKEITFLLRYDQIPLMKKGIEMIRDTYAKKDAIVPSFAIQNNDLRLEVGYSSKKRSNKHYKNLNNRFYVAIYKTKEDDDFISAKAVASTIFVFEGTKENSIYNTLFINYDETTGESENILKIQSQYAAFQNMMLSIADNGIITTSHGVAERFNYILNQILERVSDGEETSGRKRNENGFSNNMRRTNDVSEEEDDDDGEVPEKKRKRSAPSSSKKAATNSTLDEIDEIMMDDE